MVRIFLGLLVLFGVAGALDNDPNVDLFVCSIYTLVGLTLMVYGIIDIRK